MQAKDEITNYLNNPLTNKLVTSRIPQSCKVNSCILGIDEAGRGPVLGPMVYAAAYYPKSLESTLAKMPFADSKSLTENTRENLFEAIQKKGDGYEHLGYLIKIISPNMISNSMLRRKKYNLNALSHDTAIDLIRHAQGLGIKLDHVYIDTVGPAEKYKAKMESFFKGIRFTVAEKADSKYPIVSAASICAKVPRDRIISNWRYIEGRDLHLDTFELGSGYPADPGTKQFLEDSVDPVFGFPILARFSWSTITKALEKNGCNCDWNEPDEDNCDPVQLSKQQMMMKNFFMFGKKAAPNMKSTKVAQNKKQIGQSSKKEVTANIPHIQTLAAKYLSDRMLNRVEHWPC